MGYCRTRKISCTWSNILSWCKLYKYIYKYNIEIFFFKDGALLVYDITDLESFNKVRKWVKELKKIVGNDIILAIAGNKIDLEKNRQVNEEEALKFIIIIFLKIIIINNNKDTLNQLELHIFIHQQKRIVD